MKVAIVFRVSNPRLRTFGRLTIVRDISESPLTMFPDSAARFATLLRDNGVKHLRYVPEAVAERMNNRHFRRLAARY